MGYREGRSIAPEYGESRHLSAISKEGASNELFDRLEEFHIGDAIGIARDRWEIRTGAPVAA